MSFSQTSPDGYGQPKMSALDPRNDPPPDGNIGRSFAAGTADCIAAGPPQPPRIATATKPLSALENNLEAFILNSPFPLRGVGCAWCRLRLKPHYPTDCGVNAFTNSKR